MLPGADKFNMRQILSPLRRGCGERAKEEKREMFKIKSKISKQNSKQKTKLPWFSFSVKKGASSLHSGEISRAAAGTSETEMHDT
jgi:hypothetical protein